MEDVMATVRNKRENAKAGPDTTKGRIKTLVERRENDAHESGALTKAFANAAVWTSKQCGKASTFAAAAAIIVFWAITGPLFHFSDTWQLVVNTGTTIVTFLMVFLIQNTQNRDMAALHLKLDELIRVNELARNIMLNMEDMTEEELDAVKKTFARIAGDEAQPRKAG
ncbi:MAG TPA: low affinity iron permease family protein [Stellaceae bacterium]|jgi:low affinity Fe/Cu permease|nr:low affinity iron permease family protein [Stellaceae bacterium]